MHSTSLDIQNDKLVSGSGKCDTLNLVMKKYENVPLDSQLPQYEQWLKALNPGQIVNIFFLPWVGMAYRTAQFAQYAGKTTVVDVQEMDGEGVDLMGELPKKGRVILIMRSVLLSPDGLRIAREIEKWLVTFEGGVVIMHEFVPMQLAVVGHWPSWVMANQILYRMAEKGVVTDYIQNVTKIMKLKLSQDEIIEIAEVCGSWLWLVKDILRSRIENPGAKVVDLILRDSFFQKMKLIWESWPEHYKQVTMGIKKDESTLMEMSKIGLVDREAHVLGSALTTFIEKQKVEDLVLTEENIEYKGRDLTDKLMLGERRVLSRLWAKKEVIGRDDIARLFWEDDKASETTDWAIDQKMRRLRARLSKLGLPVVIVTKKGEGYGIA